MRTRLQTALGCVQHEHGVEHAASATDATAGAANDAATQPRVSDVYRALPLVLAGFMALRLRLLAVPYFDDELGYFVRRALQIFDSADWGRALLGGYAWHPALLEGLLAGFWTLVGYSVAGTRVVMCLVAVAAIAATALLGHAVGGVFVGLGAALLLSLTPPFFFHGASVTPEPLVTALTVVALLAVVKRRPWIAAGAIATASLAKLTAVAILPALVAHWTCAARWRGRSGRQIARVALGMSLIPAAVIAAWLVLQMVTPGVVVVFSDSGRFEDSQLGAALWRLQHPRRAVATFMVRATQLLVFDLRWVATLCIAGAFCLWTLRRVRAADLAALRDPTHFAWVTIGLTLPLYVVTFTLVGTDTLVRYLVPALPAFCILSAAAIRAAVPRYKTVVLGTLAGVFLASHGAGVYRVGRFLMGAANDHAGYQQMVMAYQQAFAFVEERCAAAIVAANYPAEAMAADPRLGYVTVPHVAEILPSSRAAFDTNRRVVIVVGDQLTAIPAWTRAGSLGRRWRFGQGHSVVFVIDPTGAGCAANPREGRAM